MAERVLWLDAAAGASGDLLLGALIDAGVPVGVLAEAIEKVAVGVLHEERVRLGDESATRCRVEVQDIAEQRGWRDIELLLAGAGLHEDVRSLAHDVFARLAEAESSVQGLPAEEVLLHDAGSPQAVAEVVGVCAGVVHLGAGRTVVSPGPAELELRTPIDAALMTTLADDWGPQPTMAVSAAGIGTTWGDPEGHLLRLAVGES